MRRAGGARGGANLDAVNLAARVADGQQIIVPAAAAAGDGVVPGADPAAVAPSAPVSLGSATLEQLETLDGVGPATAQKIVAYRTEHGGFRSVDDLGERAGHRAEEARRDQAPRAALSLPARYPRHAVLGALVLGMLAARHPAALLLTPMLAPRRPVLAALLLGAAFAGSWLAQARSAQLDRTALTPLVGHALDERVTLLDLPRDTPFGGWQATVSLRGECVALTAGRWVARPDAAIGAELLVAGTLKRLSPAQAWMRTRNVHAALPARAVRATGGARGGLAGVVDGVRRRAERALESGRRAASAGSCAAWCSARARR